MRFDDDVAEVLKALPASGDLFPYLRTVRASDRATEFKQRCRGLKITGVTPHSYRYSYAERARSVGYPERFAQEALGHGSKAVHRAYARNAAVEIPSLGEFEKRRLGFLPNGSQLSLAPNVSENASAPIPISTTPEGGAERQVG